LQKSKLSLQAEVEDKEFKEEEKRMSSLLPSP
jgi:hypothetical protein